MLQIAFVVLLLLYYLGSIKANTVRVPCKLISCMLIVVKWHTVFIWLYVLFSLFIGKQFVGFRKCIWEVSFVIFLDCKQLWWIYGSILLVISGSFTLVLQLWYTFCSVSVSCDKPNWSLLVYVFSVCLMYSWSPDCNTPTSLYVTWGSLAVMGVLQSGDDCWSTQCLE